MKNNKYIIFNIESNTYSVRNIALIRIRCEIPHMPDIPEQIKFILYAEPSRPFLEKMNQAVRKSTSEARGVTITRLNIGTKVWMERTHHDQAV